MACAQGAPPAPPSSPLRIGPRGVFFGRPGRAVAAPSRPRYFGRDGGRWRRSLVPRRASDDGPPDRRGGRGRRGGEGAGAAAADKAGGRRWGKMFLGRCRADGRGNAIAVERPRQGQRAGAAAADEATGWPRWDATSVDEAARTAARSRPRRRRGAGAGAGAAAVDEAGGRLWGEIFLGRGRTDGCGNVAVTERPRQGKRAGAAVCARSRDGCDRGDVAADEGDG